ncbi:hypothetical protein ABT297_31415 [Dactylosporangium sp. NPDC000555]|uniref:hypothetical protein n=1 Tax=Dactylosporangium sp. NPDC000555 TaxID=3154260 RepID=UPI00331BB23B
MVPRTVQTALGVAIALAGNALADLATFIAGRSAGGFQGCNAVLDAADRFGLFTTLVATYVIAQVVLGGAAAGLSALAKPGEAYWQALGGGWAVLAMLSVLSVLYPGC